MENNLPKGWGQANLSDLVDYKKGKKPKRMETVPFKNSLVYLDIKAIEAKVDALFVDAETSKATSESELVIVWDGARAGWVGKSRTGALGSTLMGLKPKINKDYLFRFLQTQFEYLQTNHRGTGIPHVDPDIFWNISVPVAPIAEQQRIVAKLDEVMEKIDRSRARLERIPKILKRFRQSILSAAVSGKLTEGWRRKNDTYKNWTQKQLGDVLTEIKAGKSLKCKEVPPNEGEVGIVKVSALSWGEFLEDESKTITDPKFFNEDYLIKSGDFLFSRANTNELIGAVVIVKQIHRTLMLSDKSLRFRFTSEVLPQWILYTIRSENGRKQIEDFATGNQQSMMNISQDKIREISLFIPDLQEQQEIVRRVEELFSLALKIETRYTKARAQVDKLPQSLLARAFQGELIYQDENDEPASVLIEKVKEAKSKTLEKTERPTIKKDDGTKSQQKIKTAPVAAGTSQSLIEILELNPALSKEELFQRSGMTQHEFLISLRKYQSNKQVVQLTEKGVIKFRLNANKKNLGKKV